MFSFSSFKRSVFCPVVARWEIERVSKSLHANPQYLQPLNLNYSRYEVLTTELQELKTTVQQFMRDREAGETPQERIANARTRQLQLQAEIERQKTKQTPEQKQLDLEIEKLKAKTEQAKARAEEAKARAMEAKVRHQQLQQASGAAILAINNSEILEVSAEEGPADSD